MSLVGKNAYHYGAEILSGRIFARPEPDLSVFDNAHGTDTEAIREIGSLNIDSDNARHAVRYQPSPEDLATQVINSLPIDHDRFSFVDFGAGKGRVLLIAAQLPFAAVIGIEFSPELCEVAAANINAMEPKNRKAAIVECAFGDATSYPLPATALVCYFYNPFGQVVMEAVASKLSSSLVESPREMYVVYLHPEHRALFDADDAWENVDGGEFHAIYRSRSGRIS